MKKILLALLLILPVSAHATDARMQAVNSPTAGTYRGAKSDIPMSVPVCGVDANGVPQVCNQQSPVDLSGYLTKTDASSLYVSSSVLSNYLQNNTAILTYATKSALAAEASLRATGDNNLMPLSGGDFTGPVTAPTPSVTDSSANVATTAFVTGFLSQVDMQVTGSISTVGSSLTMTFPNSNIKAVLAYTGTGSASMTFYSLSGSVSPVDIRRNSIWGGSAVETFTLDGGAITTTGTVADDTIYTASNDSSAYFIRVNGNVYFMTVWASGNGARAFIGLHRMI